jgi:hypothetical protein
VINASRSSTARRVSNFSLMAVGISPKSASKSAFNLGPARLLNSMIDTDPGTMNCIDAAGDLTSIPFDSGIAWGFVASDAVVQHLAPYFKQSRSVNLACSPKPIPS